MGFVFSFLKGISYSLRHGLDGQTDGHGIINRYDNCHKTGEKCNINFCDFMFSLCPSNRVSAYKNVC